MPRPVILGVVGDSAAGKTTLTRGLVRLLGEGNVAHIAADDYHRYDRAQRAERGITPLDPECNYIAIMEQDLAQIRAGREILKPVYSHKDGTFAPAVHVERRHHPVHRPRVFWKIDRDEPAVVARDQPVRGEHQDLARSRERRRERLAEPARKLRALPP